MSISSKAQHDMFRRAADDADYAKLRGITQDFARARLAAHEAAGSPDLPDRASAAQRRDKAAAATPQDAGRGLLGYR